MYINWGFYTTCYIDPFTYNPNPGEATRGCAQGVANWNLYAKTFQTTERFGVQRTDSSVQKAVYAFRTRTNTALDLTGHPQRTNTIPGRPTRNVTVYFEMTSTSPRHTILFLKRCSTLPLNTLPNTAVYVHH